LPRDAGLAAYEERYRVVYDAGARFWNEHQPHPLLIDRARRLPAGAAVVEFGCGEGFEARALAALGLRVTAIDLSPAVIAKARAETSASLDVSYLVGDVTDLEALLPQGGAFAMGVDVHCLHMMSDAQDRRAYLSEAKRLLRPGGLFYMQDMLSLDDVIPANDDEVRAVAEMRVFKAGHTGGGSTPRTIRTANGEKEVVLPLCPGCRAQSLAQYKSELETAGFTIGLAERGGSPDNGFAAIIIATAEGSRMKGE